MDTLGIKDKIKYDEIFKIAVLLAVLYYFILTFPS